MMAKNGAFLLESDSWNKDAHTRLSGIEHTLVDAALHRNLDACKDAIVAGMQLRTMQHIPHPPAAAKSGEKGGGEKDSEYTAPVRVRVFPRSIVEDRFILTPTLLGVIDERSPTVAQQLVLGAAQTAWAALEADVSVPHSLWVYVRLAEYALQRRMDGLGTDTAALFKHYYENMDREFVTSLGSFASTHHTVVVEVNAHQLATNDIANNVLSLLCTHVQWLHDQGFWGRCDPSSINSTFYLQARRLTAGITIAQHSAIAPPERRAALDTPPPPSPAEQRRFSPPISSTSLPESAVLASTSTPTLLRTSSTSRRVLRPVNPIGDNASGSSGHGRSH
jgi:hypothetical protein